MIIYNFTLSMAVLGSVPIVDHNETFVLDPDNYTTYAESCQQPKFESTMEYNYMTTEKLIQSYIDKCQEVLP
jgi:hypothetical protein